jgi:predicted transcriptional regulator
MKKELEIKAKKLRLKGYSVKELHKILGVSKSTVSRWIQDIELSEHAQERLRKNYTKGQLASQKTIKEKTRQKNIVADDFAKNVFSKTNLIKTEQTILCAMIYLCEGNKSLKSLMVFTNSDPSLIATFLYLFRNSFKLEEKKFRVLMHLHKYHDEKVQKEFWSKITQIPQEQFNRTYLKPTSGKYKKEGYQGCIKVYYGDVSITRKLQSIAKMFMERYK